MQTTVNLPDSLYQKSEVLASTRGGTVEQFTINAVAGKVATELENTPSGVLHPHRSADCETQLPVIPSNRPGTLNLLNFDFDDLLA